MKDGCDRWIRPRLEAARTLPKSPWRRNGLVRLRNPARSGAARGTSSRLRSLPQRQPGQHHPGSSDDRQHDEIDEIPAEMGEHRARQKRADRHGAEDEEIVERLNPGALFRTVAIGHERRSADEAEIPTDAQQNERGPEMRNRDAEEANCSACRDQPEAHRDDPQNPETYDQLPV